MTKTLNDWENPLVTGRNKQPAHALMGGYPDLASALTCDRSNSAYVRSLNGLWKFHLAVNPEHIPSGFFSESFDASGWTDIAVPGNWQLQGFDDIPIYTKPKIAVTQDNNFAIVWQDYRLLDINFMGVLHGVRSFVPRMLKQDGDAHIVNTV